MGSSGSGTAAATARAARECRPPLPCRVRMGARDALQLGEQVAERFGVHAVAARLARHLGERGALRAVQGGCAERRRPSTASTSARSSAGSAATRAAGPRVTGSAWKSSSVSGQMTPSAAAILSCDSGSRRRAWITHWAA